ncbi:MAG: hypothetical protein IJ673_04790 [Treponema sp.]|nr:hypothetical protein [Treponema sp.]
MEQLRSKPLDWRWTAGRLNVVFFDLVKVHALLGKPVEELSKLEKWGLFLSYADDERYSQYIDGLIKSEEATGLSVAEVESIAEQG